MPDFESKDFLQDIKKILKANNYLTEYRNEHPKTSLSNCYDTVIDYTNMFDNHIENGGTIQGLQKLLYTFQGLQQTVEDLDIVPENSDAYNKLVHNAGKYIESISNQKYLNGDIQKFIDMAGKGSSYGDGGLRMFMSIAQNINDVFDRVEMQNSLDTISQWEQSKDEIKASEQDIDAEMDDFVKECDDNSYVANNLHMSYSSHVNRLKKLEDDLQQVQSGDYQKKHTPEYNDIKKRMGDNALRDRELEYTENSLNTKLAGLDSLEKRLGEVQKEVNNNNIAIKKYTNKQKDLEIDIKNIDQQIENLSKPTERQESAQRFIDTMSPVQKQQINAAGFYALENMKMGNALDEMDAFIQGDRYISSDITEAYRESRESMDAYLAQDPADMIMIDKYIDLKRQFIDLDPTLAQKFMDYENNPKNKIPGDFDKVIGNELREKISQREEYIEGVKGEPYFEQYMEAHKAISERQLENNELQGLKAKKENLNTQLNEAKERVSEAQEGLLGWKQEFKDKLGDALPKGNMMSFESIQRAIRSERGKLNTEKFEVLKERKEINKQVGIDSERLSELEEGLAPTREKALQEQITKTKAKMGMAKTLGDKKQKALNSVGSLNRRKAQLSKKAEDALAGPYDALKKRLKNIHDHFEDVQSFFSKGMSNECKDMYNNLSGLIQMLDSEKRPPIEQVISKCELVQSFANDYIKAKKAQNIPKIFASNQRNWRLAKTDELQGILGNTINVLGKIQKSKVLPDMENYIENNKEAAMQDPKKILSSQLSSKQQELSQSLKNKNVSIEAEKQYSV